MYCDRWIEMVNYYRDQLMLPVALEKDWFVEFQISPTGYLSVADVSRSSRQPSRGLGITITLEVADIQHYWQHCDNKGMMPTEIKHHLWGAWQFFLVDPEGHRLEIWQQI
ncbi:MAG: VOC family protein [Chloroflexota bacterium]